MSKFSIVGIIGVLDDGKIEGFNLSAKNEYLVYFEDDSWKVDVAMGNNFRKAFETVNNLKEDANITTGKMAIWDSERGFFIVKNPDFSDYMNPPAEAFDDDLK